MHSFGDKRTIYHRPLIFGLKPGVSPGDAIKEKFEAKSASYIDGFSCLGQSRLVGNFGPRIFNKNRPDEKDIKATEQFARKILEKSDIIQ